MTPDRELAHVRRIARVLDDYFVDPVLGLVLPGAGDLIGAMLGLYTVSYALRQKVSPVIISRMLLNLALDTAFGAVPVVGDVVDFGFKAHDKNLALLEQRTANGGRATTRDWLAVGGAFLVFAATLGLVIFGIVSLFRAIV